MPKQRLSPVTCPDCGTRIEGAFSRRLGRCMICLLRVGFGEPEEPNELELLPASDRFGTYRIMRRKDGALCELGRGAMGVTYRAVDTSLQRPVALKLIHSEWSKRGAEVRERFMREARMAAALRHPNVAAVYQFGVQEESGQYFCVMELVEGETLETRVRRAGPLDTLTTIEIGLQVSSALAAAEKQGLVHRDLKPANLMLLADEDNKHTTVKVIDFGVAKALAEKPDAMGLTHGGFIGTPAFASPEQFSNAPVDVRSDIYSLGATLWYLLTAKVLFHGESVEEIRALHQSHALPREQLKAARVPGPLISLLTTMLAPEPAARPSARLLVSRLQACRAQLLDRWRTARRVSVAAGLVSGAVALVLLASRGRYRPALPPDFSEKSIAVLPFENLSGNQSDAYLVSGLREGILDKLAHVRGLKVVSRSSSAQAGSHPENLRELSRKLGADRLLTASVGKSTDHLSLEVQLIDPQTGARMWEETYRQPVAGVSGVDGEVAQKVADALKIRMAADERQHLRTAATSNPRARDLYLRARALGTQSDEKSRTQQLNLLREAVAEDPNYALAWAELSGVYIHLADAYRAPREVLTPARDAAVEAVALDENLTYGHLVLGGIALSYDWDFPLAKREIERAIALDPNSAVAHRLYGWFLARTERNYIAARQEVAKARSLEPLDTWPFWSESNIAIAQGDYESAMRMAQRVIELNPQFLYDEDPIAHVHVAAGRWQDALKRYESIPASRFNRPNFELAICYAHTGQVARARHILQELRALAQQRYVDHTHIAAIHAALGEKDEAFAALEQACKDRSARVYAPRFYPWLSPLRDDPRFLELEERIANSRLPSSNARLALPDPGVALFPSRL